MPQCKHISSCKLFLDLQYQAMEESYYEIFGAGTFCSENSRFEIPRNNKLQPSPSHLQHSFQRTDEHTFCTENGNYSTETLSGVQKLHF